MSLTTVSSASLFNTLPRVFGLGRPASPPLSPSHPRTRKPSSPARKRQPLPDNPAPDTRGRSRRPANTRSGHNTPPTGRTAPQTPTSPPRPPRRRPSRQPNPQPRPRPRSISTISTLSSLLPPPPPPDDDESVYEPPARSWRASLRALEKSNKSPAERVDAWRLGVAAAVPPEAGNNEAGTVVPDNATVAPNTAQSEGVESTEITDSQGIQDLTDEDIFALTQNIKNEEASRRPLVSPISFLEELRAEFSPFADAIGTPGAGDGDYTGPNANVLRKIDWLRKHGGWQGVRRTRGDGDCFYRSLAFAYVEKIMTAPDPGLAVATSLSHLESTLPLLEQAGFQRIVFEDFYEAFADVIQQIVPKTGNHPLTNESLLEQFQDPETSNSIVVFLRLLTSSYIRLSPEDDFTPFLIHPDTGEMVDVRTFVETFVEATGREADHPQIMALSKALRVRIEVAYLDNSAGSPLPDGTLPIDFVKFAPDGAEEDGTKPVVLLYRPGHYDTLEEKVEA